MVDIKEILNKVNDKLNEIINDFEGIDSYEPFKKEDFAYLKDTITTLYQSSAQTMDSLVDNIVSLKNQKDTLLDIYEENSAELLNSLDERLAVIKKKYEDNINGLNEEINNSKLTNQQTKENTLQDIEFFKRSSSQHVEMFVQENKDAINRYNYQYSIAKESYGDNIIYYNDQLAEELNRLKNTYLTAIKEYKKETEEMIQGYNSRILEQTQILEGYNKEYKEKLSNFKVLKRNETEDLNDKIRSLGAEKDEHLEHIKNEYTASLNKLNDKRDQDNQENTIKNQNIIKDFVYNMDELDQTLNEQKARYNKQKDDENESYFENKLSLHKAHEKEIIDLLNGHPSKPKSSIKKINKEYYDIELENEKAHKSIIERIEREYNIAAEANAYQKKRLDIIRTSSIKALSLDEIRNNKHYQEENNRLENEMSFETSIANHRYNIDANNIRLESNYKMLGFERQIGALDADHQKSVRKINNVIRANKLEIDYANQINSATEEFQTSRYERTVNYLTVTNLLEIEKCKLLNNFNRKSYELNILNSNVSLNYSKINFDLKNRKYRETKEHWLKLEDKKLEALINTTAYRIQELSYNEEKEYAIEKQNKIYSVDVLSHNVLVNRFKLNIKSLNQALSAFILLVKRLEVYFEEAINYILDNVEINESTFPLVHSFISRLATTALDYNKDLIELYEKISTGIINNHLEFEGDFKFKTMLTQLKEKYVADTHYIQGEINRLKASIKDTVDKIENITTRVTRLELTNSFDKNRKRSKSIVSKNKKTIKKLFKLIKKNELENERAKSKIRSLNAKLLVIQKHYLSDVNQIKRLQYNSAQAYHILKNSIVETTKSMLQALNNYNLKASTITPNKEAYIELITKAKHDFIYFNVSEIKKLYTVMNTFNISNGHNLAASLNKINAENVLSIRKIKEATYTKINNAKEAFSKTDANIRSDIDALKKEGLQIERDYQKLEKQAKRSFDNSVNNILESRHQSQASFFTELYAITDNSNDIKDSYIQDINERNKEFEAKKADILSKTISAKNDFNEKLNRYIQTRNLIIKNLPYNFKEKKLAITEENKEKNTEIEFEISQMKTSLYQKRKDIKRNLNNIESTFQANNSLISIEKKKLLAKERRKYYYK